MSMKVLLIWLVILPLLLFGQENGNAQPLTKEPTPKEPPQAPTQVQVKPRTADYEISQRLEEILKATGWFQEVHVKVDRGVVFLKGTAQTEELKDWAQQLASKIQDTVAVVNHMDVAKPSIWEFKPVIVGLKEQWHGVLRTIPTIIFGMLILGVTFLAARSIAMLARFILKNRINNSLLLYVISILVGTFIFLIGLYVVFNLMGLTTVAFTVMGGTGLLGIILGIAFKDITENFLASILLSVNNPFRTGDLITIEGVQGIVQKLTLRSTVLMKMDGTYVQIPNSTVYKSIINNFSSNPNYREEISIGIGYDSQITVAQDIAIGVLESHPAVLQKPEPRVLVDSLGAATVNLKIYFWFNREEHGWLQVRSSVMRLIKDAFQQEGISLPDEGRERVFPEGLLVQIADQKTQESMKKAMPPSDIAIMTEAEGSLQLPAQELKEQAKSSTMPEEGGDLLTKNGDANKK